MYVSALDVSPVYLLNDEIFGALQAMSLASTGRSLSGEWFPVFFRGLEFPPGRDPLFVYATAAAFKLAGISEVSLRVPTALVGIACIVLTYVLGRRMWGRATYGLLAAIVLALTPAFFINSRIGIPTLWSVPWILGWLLALAIYVGTAAAAGPVCRRAVSRHFGLRLSRLGARRSVVRRRDDCRHRADRQSRAFRRSLRRRSAWLHAAVDAAGVLASHPPRAMA